jgi:ferric-dicitrate binding protein FerR (iron transport regulator)
MPGTMPTIDRSALARLQAGDEQALRRIFDDHYATLTQEAATVVEDPSSAPRVVENVFVRVWEERATFDTPEALEAFLHRATREAAARAQSRRASLHRFEAHEGVHMSHEGAHARKPPATAEEAWIHLQQTIHARADRSHSVQEVAEHARHAAAEHVSGMTKRKPWLWPAIGLAAVALIVLTPIVLIDRASEDRAVTAALRARDARTLVAAQGQRTVLQLGDGTDVTLGADSRLTVPPGFGDRLRGVGLEGTGTFVVAPGQSRIFQVRAKDVAVKAMSTTFTVRAYPDEDFVAVRVKEGQVTVQTDKGTRSVAAGEAVFVTNDEEMRDPTPQEVDEALGWAEGRFVLREMPVRDALTRLQRWYALGLVVRDSAILDRRVSMNVSLDSSRNAISALERGAQVQFGYEGRIRVLRDARKK